MLQPTPQLHQNITERCRVATHQQLTLLGRPMQCKGHLDLRRDHQQQWVIPVVGAQGQALESPQGTGLIAAGQSRQCCWMRTQLIQLIRSPHPSLQMLEQLRFIESRQGGSQPDSAFQAALKQVLLQGFQSSPPKPPNTNLIAAALGHVLRQPLPQVGEGGPGQRSCAKERRLCRTTDRQRPSAMKFTTMAERP